MSAQENRFDDDESENDLHWEAIERLLFIYAKLNPAISYVQGMNELIAPLYYVPPDQLSSHLSLPISLLVSCLGGVRG